MNNSQVVYIDKDVTMRKGEPPRRTSRRGLKYPFDKLTPGSYLQFEANHPGSMVYSKTKVAKVASPAYAFAKRQGWKFSVLQDNTGVTRVYRTK